MATIAQTKEAVALAEPRFDLDVGTWLRNTVFNNISTTIFAVILIIANVPDMGRCQPLGGYDLYLLLGKVF